MSIGHDGDGECSGFSDFSLQATKRQTSAQPVHRFLALGSKSRSLTIVVSASFVICDIAQAGETRSAVIAVWMAKALASHRQPSSQS